MKEDRCMKCGKNGQSNNNHLCRTEKEADKRQLKKLVGPQPGVAKMETDSFQVVASGLLARWKKMKRTEKERETHKDDVEMEELQYSFEINGHHVITDFTKEPLMYSSTTFQHRILNLWWNRRKPMYSSATVIFYKLKIRLQPSYRSEMFIRMKNLRNSME